MIAISLTADEAIEVSRMLRSVSAVVPMTMGRRRLIRSIADRIEAESILDDPDVVHRVE